jgi:glutamate dehydrogenase
MTADRSNDSDDRAPARVELDQDLVAVERRVSEREEFATALFARAAPEDVVRYEPQVLAALAASTWEFLAERRPGAPKIRISSPGPEAGKELKDISILDIVNDDMPFLVDSTMAELNERKIEVFLVAHPIIGVERDAGGRLLGFNAEAPRRAARRESVIHVHIARIEDGKQKAELIAALERVLRNVRLAVEDWKPMLARVSDVIADIKANPPPLPVDELGEAIHFLEWLVSDNFTFLGVSDYLLSAGETDLEPRVGSGLGILRGQDVQVLRRAGEPVSITPEILAFLKEPRSLIITKANARSLVHRRVHMDYIGVKRFSPDGRLLGEFRIVGLFTSTAYTRPARSIPYLRRKLDRVIGRMAYPPDSHSGKALANVLETYPRDELFQIDDELLAEYAQIIMLLEERPRLRVLARRDRFDRFVSVIMYVPRERYDSTIHEAVTRYLTRVFKARLSAFFPYYADGPLVRIHFILGRKEADAPMLDRPTLERAIEELGRSWTDRLANHLRATHEPGRARFLAQRYASAFSAAYREAYSPGAAVSDINRIERLSAERPLSVDFHDRRDGEEGTAALKVWSFDRPIPLSERVPVLEHMGFRVVDEHTYHVEIKGKDPRDFWLHDMMVEGAARRDINVKALKSRLDTCFMMVMRGFAENDGYNALVLTAGLGWRDIALVRAISRYLRQICIPYSQDYMWATLVKHAAIAEKIVALFHAKFDTTTAVEPPVRAARTAAIAAEIEAALKDVPSLDEDRILRRFLNAVNSALRTSFYQLDKDGRAKAEIAIKYASRDIEDMPLPRPLYEIFVYSPRVEAIHLRFGKVARGGIRWSDRPQDFRTEVLGLVKAQQVKNAVIVPVGAKGGFVPKRLPANGTRDAIQAEGIAAYKLFIGTLLDLTDNLTPRGIVPPQNAIRFDDDDPYLVVAADKGTATFSDIANGLGQERGFWLDDAFASGGSAGYDHKAMGITARGAWESVKRHFREMDIDVRTMPFRVAGVGDMSGDVFGNGMLREKTIKLVAAFDHRDIFIDPDPDPAASFAERARLFALPRSSWQDYSKALLSKGGGVYSRALKEITLSPEAQAALGFGKARAAPHEIISAILRAPVDLLYFGGIGTYVRADNESDDAVGDRANDAVRIAGTDLRCKVIAEGANLGMTQRGRIQAAQRGIRLNTDAIDNSAGVNTSDLEVNIKIATSVPMSDGRLTREDRNKLLASMTDEVAALVLRNNYQQTLAISLAQRGGMAQLGFQQRLMQTLEARRLLDRAVEFLPDDMQIEERRRHSQPLTRPELAVLLAYAKLTLHADLLASSVPDDAYLGRELLRYFPHTLSQHFPDAIEHHRLRREIIATQLANAMINRCGPSGVVQIADRTGATPDRIALAFAAVRGSYGLIELNSEIDALDTKIAGDLQLGLYASVQELLIDRLVWFLRNADLTGGLEALIARYRDGIAAIAGALESLLADEAAAARQKRIEQLVGGAVPDELARRLANLAALRFAPDIVLVADRTGKAVKDVAATYFAAGAYFRLDRVTAAAREIKVSDYFDRLALDRALSGIEDAQRRLTADMVAHGAGAAAVDAWIKPRAADVERIRLAVHEIADSGLTLSKLAVAASMLGDLVRG